MLEKVVYNKPRTMSYSIGTLIRQEITCMIIKRIIKASEKLF